MKFLLSYIILFAVGLNLYGQRPMEYLDRGLVALQNYPGVYLSWRMLGTDPEDVGFLIYRNGQRLSQVPYTATTNFLDEGGSVNDRYFIKTVIDNSVVETSDTVEVWGMKAATQAEDKPSLPFKRIPIPEPPVMEGTEFTPGDMAIGDLDGDGDYELVYEWEASTSYNPYMDAIDMEGNLLWRINAGPNTSTNHLSFLVWDFDMDGRAEVAFKTGPGTVDGTGAFLSKGPAATDDDQLLVARSSGGRFIADPSYITVFDGPSGKELATVDYYPAIGPYVEMEDTWGDDYGHRSNSIKAAALYNDELGKTLLVFTRGIYTRIGMAAYSFDGEELQQEWWFDTENEEYKNYEGEGNHSVSVGDVDGDGSDELMYGACAIDHDGTGLYATGRGHGDADHLGDHIPDRPGMEFFQPHENNIYGLSMRDAATGEIIWEYLSPADVGRAWAADTDPAYPGAEVSAIGFPVYDAKGDTLPLNPDSFNPYFQPIYFDGDVQRELRKETAINGVVGGPGRIFTGWYYGASTIHSTKEDANMVADIIGDWREEIIFRNNDNSYFLLFTTWLPTDRKNYTLMHDPTYRMNIVVQNIGYNQPANVGYYFPDGAPVPDIEMIKYTEPDTTNTDTLSSPGYFPGNSDRLLIFPNPASDKLHIVMDQDQSEKLFIEVYSMNGKLELSTILFNREESLDIEMLQDGIYVMKARSESAVFTKRFMVSKLSGIK